MPLKHFREAGWSGWSLIALAVAGLAVAAFYTLDAGNGIAYTPGTYLVLGSTALLMLGVLLLISPYGARGPLRKVLICLILLDLLGTGFAAYLLEAWALLAITAMGLLAWLAMVLRGPQLAIDDTGARWRAAPR